MMNTQIVSFLLNIQMKSGANLFYFLLTTFASASVWFGIFDRKFV